MKHRDLCKAGARFMKKHGIKAWEKPTYVVCELEVYGESPDVFGFGGGLPQLIEVKTSRSDFLADKKKSWRINPERGLGELRSYLCPEGLISVDELPENWGLIYINEESGEMTKIKEPNSQPSCVHTSMRLAASILRREGIKPQVFSYKKYVADMTIVSEKDIVKL